MRRFSLICFATALVACGPVTAQEQIVTVSSQAQPLVDAARARLAANVLYDGRYVALEYPGGDVPASIGVCTDVVIRSLRRAYNFDLQRRCMRT